MVVSGEVETALGGGEWGLVFYIELRVENNHSVAQTGATVSNFEDVPDRLGSPNQ